MTAVSPRRRKVALGLVGTGPLWEQSYCEAVRRYSKYVAIRGVYDAVQARAEQTARDWQAVVAPSLTSLFERPEIDAVLLMDTAWYGLFPLELACRYRKPALWVGNWGRDLDRLERIYDSARESGVTLMAALPRRHTPATNRLRELMATKFGRPRAVQIESWQDPSMEFTLHHVAGVVDWCRYVMGKAPASVKTARKNGSPQKWQVDLQFSVGTNESLESSVLVFFQETAERPESVRISFQQGVAIIQGESEIQWQHDGQDVRDSLASERGSTEIILDQFCRRVVGGLVPVADVGDVLGGLRIAQTIQQQVADL